MNDNIMPIELFNAIKMDILSKRSLLKHRFEDLFRSAYFLSEVFILRVPTKEKLTQKLTFFN
jgi:hypothetical protein